MKEGSPERKVAENIGPSNSSLAERKVLEGYKGEEEYGGGRRCGNRGYTQPGREDNHGEVLWKNCHPDDVETLVGR
jgi:hypothetical protein